MSWLKTKWREPSATGFYFRLGVVLVTIPYWLPVAMVLAMCDVAIDLIAWLSFVEEA